VTLPDTSDGTPLHPPTFANIVVERLRPDLTTAVPQATLHGLAV
jgi:hypothetical protein